MRGASKSPAFLSLLITLAAVSLFASGCTQNSAGGGDKKGTDSKPVIAALQTPLGLTGTRGTGPDVPIIYNIRDRQYDPAEVEIQYGVDLDGNLLIDESEWFVASPKDDPRNHGTSNLETSPGTGSLHTYVWSSLDDILTGRHVTQDFVYTDTGRVLLDRGEPVFESFPGVRVRIRPTARGKQGKWAETDAFEVNNNNKPWVTISSPDVPPEGATDQTCNEDVYVDWKAFDPDEDSVTIAVDWVAVPSDYGDTARTSEELEDLGWKPATSSTAGDGTANLPAGRGGIDHTWVWSSVVDTGTVNGWMLLRFRPLDQKREVGYWQYLGTEALDAENNPTGVWTVTPFHLDNYTIFTDPGVGLPEARVGAVATLLEDESVLVTGGSATEGGTSTDTAVLFYPGPSQTTAGNVAVVSSMGDARAHHTATRLLDGRVLVVGGTGASGSAIDSAEIYDPEADPPSFSAVGSSLGSARTNHVAVRLRSGSVLIAGGEDENGNRLDTAEIFDRASETFVPVVGSSMSGTRTDARALMLPDGRVLIAGGSVGAGTTLNVVELFDPMAGVFLTPAAKNDLESARSALSLTETVHATIGAIAAGGMATLPGAKEIERFDWLTDSWTTSGKLMRDGRSGHLGILLGDNKILFAGGQTDTGALTATADIYDLTADEMDEPNGDLVEPLRDACSTMLRMGRPAIFGGVADTGPTAMIEIFTPDGGFNYPPRIQIKSPTSLEPWSFGVRFNYRVTD
ncbi:MAG: Kelch repeat-containing protein, partial [Planctomycetota bacterium]